MDANILAVSLLGILGAYIGYVGWSQASIQPPTMPTSLWGQQVGKTRSLQTMNGDASMSTEKIRRQVIQRLGKYKPSEIKESRTLLGTTTGAIETFMITGLQSYTPPTIPCPPDIIFDGGNETSAFCQIPGSASYDAGNQTTKACGI